MGRKAATPLFELLADRAQPTERPRPVVPPRTPSTPTPTSKGLPRTEAPVAESVEPTAAGWTASAGEFAIRGGVVRMPTSYGLIAVAAILVVLVGAWAMGYLAGESRATREAEARLNALAPAGDLGGTIREPEPQAPPGPRSEGPPESPSGPIAGESLAQKPPSRPAISPQGEAPAAFDAGGALAGDPRPVGLNYLVLGELGFEDAASAVERLAAAGVGVVAVRVDRASGRSNNAVRYALFTSEGLTAEQYRSDRAARGARLDAVKRVGARWRSEGGPTDFSTAYWDKLD